MSIKTIIFDLGNVVVKLDQRATEEAFSQMLLPEVTAMDVMDIAKEYEIGLLTENQWITSILKLLKPNTTAEEVIKAWNAMLVKVHVERFAVMKSLKEKYQVVVISNNNVTHLDFVNDYLTHNVEGKLRVEDFCHQAYYSHIVGIAKPDSGIYKYALTELKLKGNECVFIDDISENIEAAERLGIKGILLEDFNDFDRLLQSFTNQLN